MKKRYILKNLLFLMAVSLLLSACDTIYFPFGKNAASLPHPAPTLCHKDNIPMTSREVFFDIDSVTLNPDAQITLQELAEEIKRTQPQDVIIHGYADRSGPAAYNARLGLRRAQAVSAALQKNGVPAGLIRIESCGEQHAAIPTKDGVKFRENRRVIIQQIH